MVRSGKYLFGVKSSVLESSYWIGFTLLRHVQIERFIHSCIRAREAFDPNTSRVRPVPVLHPLFGQKQGAALGAAPFCLMA